MNIEESYEKEFQTLKSGFDVKYRECYDQISAIVKGEVTTPQISAEEKTKYGITEGNEGEAGIPDYWMTAIKNSNYLMINEKDEEILKFLKDCRMKQADPSKADFTVEFEFAPNDFFSETVLTKTYFFDEKTEELTKTQGCPISWKSQDKNPRIKVATKKVKKGKKTETKTTEKLVPSFFDIFADESKGEFMLADEGNFFREDFFANSLEYYLNLFPEEDDDFEDEEMEDEEDEEDEEDKKDKKKKGGKPKAGGAQQNEKCKNQ